MFFFPVQWPVTDPRNYIFVRVNDLDPRGQVITLGYIWFALKDFDPTRPAVRSADRHLVLFDGD